MRLYVSFMVAIIMAVFLAACGGGGGAAPKPKEEAAAPKTATLNIVQHDIYYGDAPNNAEKPPTWTVPAGSKVTVNMKNEGALEHNWAIVKPGSKVPVPFVYDSNKDMILAETGLVKAGSSATHDITAPAPGEYEVICTVAGHYPLMQGRLVVK